MIDHLDHLVLTTAGEAECIRFNTPVPGALDLCFIAAAPLQAVIVKPQAAKVPIVEGPVLRTGTTAQIRSVHAGDPDLNLIEISELA